MISVYRADQLKRFAPFSYLNHSFILSLNVKVCIRFMVFLQIPLFLYLSRVMLDERFVHQLHIFMFFVSSWRGEQFEEQAWGGGGGVKKFEDLGGLPVWGRGCFCWGSLPCYMPLERRPQVFVKLSFRELIQWSTSQSETYCIQF